MSIAATGASGWAPRPDHRPANIVDRLISERAPHLVGSAVGRRLLEQLLYPLLNYPKAVELAGRAAAMPGHEIFEMVRQELAQRVVVSGLEHVPARGRVIAVANHPTGLADGIAVWGALRRVRPDLWFLANADALRLAPGLADLIVPVEWLPEKRGVARTRDMLKATARLLRDEQLLMIFPAGRLSYFSWRGLAERTWQPTTISLARKFKAPILPMRLVARNSALFYVFSQLSSELRDITLFHELLNKRDGLFEIQIAPVIDADRLPEEPTEAVRSLQCYVEKGLRNRTSLLRRPHRSPLDAALALPH